jgi:hypothetical protein
MSDEEPRDPAAEAERPEDPSKGCFACQNMDAYWAEKARTNPDLRDRLAALEKARRSPEEHGPPAAEDPEDRPPVRGR